MPTPIIFTITTAGRVAALDAFDNGLTIALTHCAFGSGKYTPTGSETALNTELGRVGLSGGAIESVSATLRFSAALAASTHINAFEIGLFSSTGVLFAVASTTSTTIPLTVVEPNIETICAFGLVLGDVPTSSLTIAIDPSATLAIQLINQHVAAANPHPQYKRRLDNTERMKVAAAVDGDDAIRKDTLDALRVRLVANGIDANLGVTNHLPNINIDPFLIPEGYFDGSTLGDKPFPYGICRTRKEDNGVVYQFAQSSANGDFATRMYRESVGHWTDWKYYASLNGNSTEFFSVKTATSDNHAPTYRQLLDGLNAVAGGIPSISGKADLAGSSSQLFSAADGVSGKNVVNVDQLNVKTSIATDSQAGIVEKALLAELVAGTSDKYPDAALLLNGFSADLTSNGSIKLPSFLGGIIIEWGRATYGDLETGGQYEDTITFTNTFASILTAQVSGYSPTGGSNAFSVNIRNITLTQLTSALQEWGAGNQGTTAGYNWLVIGI